MTGMAETQTGPIALFSERILHMRGVHPGGYTDAPYYLGLALISFGILALAVFIWLYRSPLCDLWSRKFHRRGIIEEKNKYR